MATYYSYGPINIIHWHEYSRILIDCRLFFAHWIFISMCLAVWFDHHHHQSILNVCILYYLFLYLYTVYLYRSIKKISHVWRRIVWISFLFQWYWCVVSFLCVSCWFWVMNLRMAWILIHAHTNSSVYSGKQEARVAQTIYWISNDVFLSLSPSPSLAHN